MLGGILEFNYSCPVELSEKNHLFHKISSFHESFRTLGEKCSKLCPTLFFDRAIEKATYLSRGSLWRKTKGFKCFNERWFFKIVYGLWSEKFALSEKNNFLVSKNSILCVQKNVLGENQNLCIKKLFFFCKILSAIEAKSFGLLGKLFPARLSSFRSISAEEGFREKFLENFFFIVSRLGAKNRLLKEDQVECGIFIPRVRWSFSGKIFFLKLFNLFFHVFRAKNCNFEKNSRRILKIAFYTSKGTSWWNYFGSLKTFFP